MPEYMLVAEVAAHFRKDQATVRRWLAEGDMFPGAKKIKGGWLIPKADVERHFQPPPEDERPVIPAKPPRRQLSRGIS